MEIAWSAIAPIITAISALIGALITLWKLAKAQAKTEMTADEAEKALEAKDREIERLWALLDTLTRPDGGR